MRNITDPTEAFFLPLPGCYPPAKVTTILISVTVDHFWCFGTFYKWNHMAGSLLCLASFPKFCLWGLLMWLCVAESHYFSLLYSFLLYEYTAIFFIHPTIDECLCCFQCGAIVNDAAVDVVVCVFWWTYVCIFVGYTPRSGIAGS